MGPYSQEKGKRSSSQGSNPICQSNSSDQSDCFPTRSFPFLVNTAHGVYTNDFQSKIQSNPDIRACRGIGKNGLIFGEVLCPGKSYIWGSLMSKEVLYLGSAPVSKQSSEHGNSQKGSYIRIRVSIKVDLLIKIISSVKVPVVNIQISNIQRIKRAAVR
jgi:hypothetical protein